MAVLDVGLPVRDGQIADCYADEGTTTIYDRRRQLRASTATPPTLIVGFVISG